MITVPGTLRIPHGRRAAWAQIRQPRTGIETTYGASGLQPGRDGTRQNCVARFVGFLNRDRSTDAPEFRRL